MPQPRSSTTHETQTLAATDESPCLRQPTRCIAVRPFILSLAILCLAIGMSGLVIAWRNFTFLPQDGDQLPQSFWDAQNAKQPLLEFGCSILPIGFVGLVLLVLSFRRRRLAR